MIARRTGDSFVLRRVKGVTLLNDTGIRTIDINYFFKWNRINQVLSLTYSKVNSLLVMSFPGNNFCASSNDIGTNPGGLPSERPFKSNKYANYLIIKQT